MALFKTGWVEGDQLNVELSTALFRFVIPGGEAGVGRNTGIDSSRTSPAPPQTTSFRTQVLQRRRSGIQPLRE